MASPPPRRTTAKLGSAGATEKHFAMHIAINGQVFRQSGTAGASSGQHGMSSGIANITETAAVMCPLTGAVSGPATSPKIARIASSLRG